MREKEKRLSKLMNTDYILEGVFLVAIVGFFCSLGIEILDRKIKTVSTVIPKKK